MFSGDSYSIEHLFRLLKSTSAETHGVSATKNDRSVLFKERFDVYFENDTKHKKYSLWAECSVLVF
jgi:hypothetical protein